METHVENLWNKVDKKEYSKIPEIIKSNPNEDLVNSVHPNPPPKSKAIGRSLAMHVILEKDMRRDNEILKAVFADPKLDLDYKNPRTKSTVFSALLNSACPEAFRCLKDNPKIIFKDDEFTYGRVEELLKAHEEILKEEEEDPEINEEDIESTKLHIQNLKEIKSILRDVTILHAIKKDDADLMQRLEDSGCNIDSRLSVLGQNKWPTDLLKPDGNIRKLFSESQTKSLGKVSNNLKTLFKEMDKLKELDGKAEKMIKDSQKAKLDLLKESAKKTDDIIKKFNF